MFIIYVANINLSSINVQINYTNKTTRYSYNLTKKFYNKINLELVSFYSRGYYYTTKLLLVKAYAEIFIIYIILFLLTT